MKNNDHKFENEIVEKQQELENQLKKKSII